MVNTLRGIQNHTLAFEVNPIGAGGQTLHLIQVFLFRFAVEFVPGVDQGQFISVNHR